MLEKFNKVLPVRYLIYIKDIHFHNLVLVSQIMKNPQMYLGDWNPPPS